MDIELVCSQRIFPLDITYSNSSSLFIFLLYFYPRVWIHVLAFSSQKSLDLKSCPQQLQCRHLLPTCDIWFCCCYAETGTNGNSFQLLDTRSVSLTFCTYQSLHEQIAALGYTHLAAPVSKSRHCTNCLSVASSCPDTTLFVTDNNSHHGQGSVYRLRSSSTSWFQKRQLEAGKLHVWSTSAGSRRGWDLGVRLRNVGPPPGTHA